MAARKGHSVPYIYHVSCWDDKGNITCSYECMGSIQDKDELGKFLGKKHAHVQIVGLGKYSPKKHGPIKHMGVK